MRITEKKENGFYELKKGQEIYGEEDGIRLVQIVGEYEDIEEKLGINLIKFITALTSDVYLYHNGELVKCEQVPCLLCFDGKYCLEYHFEFDVEQVYLKDYGKTWALTREELEWNITN